MPVVGWGRDRKLHYFVFFLTDKLGVKADNKAALAKNKAISFERAVWYRLLFAFGLNINLDKVANRSASSNPSFFRARAANPVDGFGHLFLGKDNLFLLAKDLCGNLFVITEFNFWEQSKSCLIANTLPWLSVGHFNPRLFDEGPGVLAFYFVQAPANSLVDGVAEDMVMIE